MRERLSLWSSAAGIFLLLPYVLTFLLSGAEIPYLHTSLDLEKCLPVLTQSQLDGAYGMEMKKAQTVLLRTNARVLLEEGQSLTEILYRYCRERKTQKPESLEAWREYRTAAAETKGEVLTLEGKAVEVPYHQLSNGSTRSGETVFPDDSMDYLTSVESPADCGAESYGTTVDVERSRLPEELKTAERDPAGYVLNLQADEQLLPGELFRVQMGLPSSCFSMAEQEDGVMRFFCRGQGHGLGLSQYGGAVLEQEGMAYPEILQYYFPLLSLEEQV